jgi:hypothetical protein
MSNIEGRQEVKTVQNIGMGEMTDDTEKELQNAVDDIFMAVATGKTDKAVAVEILKTEKNIAIIKRNIYDDFSYSNYQKYIAYIDIVIERLNVLPVKQQETPPATQETHLQSTPAETTVMTYYPQFGKDFQKLIDGRCMKRIENGLQWLYSKQSLAEYFKSLPRDGKQMHWQEIEILFGVKNLKAALSTNGNWCKKTSKDYMKLKELLTEK